MESNQQGMSQGQRLQSSYYLPSTQRTLESQNSPGSSNSSKNSKPQRPPPPGKPSKERQRRERNEFSYILIKTLSCFSKTEYRHIAEQISQKHKVSFQRISAYCTQMKNRINSISSFNEKFDPRTREQGFQRRALIEFIQTFLQDSYFRAIMSQGKMQNIQSYLTCKNYIFPVKIQQFQERINAFMMNNPK